MKQNYLPKSLTALVLAMISTMLCMTASFAYGAQVNSSKNESGAVTKNALVQHEHALHQCSERAMCTLRLPLMTIRPYG